MADSDDSPPTYLGLRGLVFDAPVFGQLRAWPDGGVIFDPAAGLIVAVGDYSPVSRANRPLPVRWLDVTTPSGARAVICPGLVDVHAHLPQYPASGRGQGELLPWLKDYIFPLEREFSAARSRQDSPRFFRELARHGTTSAMLYAAVTDDSCDAAFQAAEASGLRITLGKMMMDLHSYGEIAPEKIVSVSLAQSERLIRRWHGANDGLISYALSPRFAVSCTEKMMRGAAELAEKYTTPIQTHLAENLSEIERVRQLYPTARDYTDVYDRCGLVTARSVFGHCIHLSDREIQTLSQHVAKVAHCPTANFYLSSGLLPLKKLRDAGITVGLGSDVGAGPELNLWQVMRAAIDTQRARSYTEPSNPPLQPVEAFHLATQGGADTLNLGRTLGSLDPGKEADLLVLDPAAVVPYGDAAQIEPQELVTLCVYRGGPQATVATFVRGRVVYAQTAGSLSADYADFRRSQKWG